MSAYKALLNAPTSYVREDGAEMVELKPHQFVSRIALATICSPRVPSSLAAAKRKVVSPLWAD